MPEKKEIKEEELDKVTGGFFVADEVRNKIVLGQQINIYETAYHINEEIYLEDTDSLIACAGTLLESREGSHHRIIKMDIKYGSFQGNIKQIKLDNKGSPDEYQRGDSKVWLIASYK